MLSTTAPLPLPAGGAQSMPGCDHGPRPQAARQSAALGGHLGRGHGGRAAILAEGGAGPGPGRRERPALGRAAAKGREVRPVRAGGRGGASRRARIREVRPQNVRFGRREWGRGAKILHRNPELSVGRRAKGFVHSQLRGAVAVAAPAAGESQRERYINGCQKAFAPGPLRTRLAARGVGVGHSAARPSSVRCVQLLALSASQRLRAPCPQILDN
ncbi:uncharacterized protein LOC110407645 isoform X2 [Numida meleagris]|uniref:uncharacterized protein LOC110407645 isoform X2 n=1 Tax=Numida meleagris TaxID=8996 RepID=UPI000B3DBE37|nr:uncharacterized protein LOC110407645 isoform X2 [Numida meleagris]